MFSKNTELQNQNVKVSSEISKRPVKCKFITEYTVGSATDRRFSFLKASYLKRIEKEFTENDSMKLHPHCVLFKSP